MPKYIVLFFLVMGFAFYELSGGSDFVPRSAAIKAAIAKADASATGEGADAARAPQSADASRAIPARKPLEVTQLVATPAVVRAPAVARASDAPGVAADKAAAQAGRATAPDPAGGQVVLASLERGDTTFGNVLSITPQNSTPAVAEVARAEPEPQTDIRQVTATRVNVRTGPSTNFDVLTKVRRGQKVEVLGDNGEGWLRLRLLPEDRVGWIAARLVSPAG